MIAPDYAPNYSEKHLAPGRASTDGDWIGPFCRPVAARRLSVRRRFKCISDICLDMCRAASIFVATGGQGQEMREGSQRAVALRGEVRRMIAVWRRR